MFPYNPMARSPCAQNVNSLKCWKRCIKDQLGVWKKKGNGNNIMKYLSLITLGFLLLGSTFWEPSDLVLSLVVGFLADCLHKHEFTSLLVDIPSNIMRARLCSCAGLGVGIWLLAHPTTLTFHLSSTQFFTTLCTYLGLSHPIDAHLFSWC